MSNVDPNLVSDPVYVSRTPSSWAFSIASTQSSRVEPTGFWRDHSLACEEARIRSTAVAIKKPTITKTIECIITRNRCFRVHTLIWSVYSLHIYRADTLIWSVYSLHIYRADTLIWKVNSFLVFIESTLWLKRFTPWFGRFTPFTSVIDTLREQQRIQCCCPSQPPSKMLIQPMLDSQLHLARLWPNITRKDKSDKQQDPFRMNLHQESPDTTNRQSLLKGVTFLIMLTSL